METELLSVQISCRACESGGSFQLMSKVSPSHWSGSQFSLNFSCFSLNFSPVSFKSKFRPAHLNLDCHGSFKSRFHPAHLNLDSPRSFKSRFPELSIKSSFLTQNDCTIFTISIISRLLRSNGQQQGCACASSQR